VLNQFSDSPALVDELFPYPGRRILAAVDTLIEMEFLLHTDLKCLITGCGRSGTKYISQLLSTAGLRIGHESMRKDGIASWPLAVDADRVPWGPSRRRFRFQQILHQTRDPLAAISSIQTMRPASWQYICQHIPCSMGEPLLLRCAKYWSYWNLKAESIATWRYPVENIGLVWDDLCSRLEIPADRTDFDLVRRDINTREGTYQRIGWDDLEAVDRALCLAIRQQATRYGYPI